MVTLLVGFSCARRYADVDRLRPLQASRGQPSLTIGIHAARLNDSVTIESVFLPSNGEERKGGSEGALTSRLRSAGMEIDGVMGDLSGNERVVSFGGRRRRRRERLPESAENEVWLSGQCNG